MSLGFLRRFGGRRVDVPATAIFKVRLKEADRRIAQRRITAYLHYLVAARTETINNFVLDWDDDNNASFRVSYGDGQVVTGTVLIEASKICLDCALPVRWGQVYASVLGAFRRQMKDEYLNFDSTSALQLSAGGLVAVRQ
jgi:hypothetical protein